MMRLLKSTDIDLEKNVKECVVWSGSKDEWGYGQIAVRMPTGKYRTIHASRASWLIFRGPIPEGKMVCHSCDNPGCYNPNHLYIGSQSRNIYDSYDKGRSVYRPPEYKDPEKYDEILACWLYYGLTRPKIAKALNLPVTHVCYALKRARKYNHIDKRARGMYAHKLPEILASSPPAPPQ